ncbi:uncharacterized protein LOC128221311 isoform X2 [Mya arenaria]|nr:uncharacterized protein LOC128221311 isoform X2 [Mya arenaria]
MDRDPYHEAWMSLRLSRVLDDIGANRRVVMKRRDTFLLREAIETLIDTIYGIGTTNYHFGSQSEGSTTPGMNSDIDLVMCCNKTNIMSDWVDWEAGMINFLMVKEETTPPQHYWLQIIRQDSPEPIKYNGQMEKGPYVDGRFFFSNRNWHEGGVDRFGNRYKSSGPSRSFSDKWDFVLAFKCKVLPPEVDRWFRRPRCGQWPTPEMMKEASECSCFLVPVGHFESRNEDIEWRLSPSQIERILVFSFTTVQLKCYVILKMIKNYINEHYFSIHSKFTSFHCKTVMFFTMERLSPAEWREDRLTKCIHYCLQTLEMFLVRCHCPNYIFPEVNLFEGKITRRYQLLLFDKIKEFLNDDLMILYDLQVDSIGQRIQIPTRNILVPRSSLYQTINNVLAGDLIECVSGIFLSTIKNELNPVTFRRFLTALSMHEDGNTISRMSRNERQALSVFQPHIYSLFASVNASYAIEHGIPLRLEIFHFYDTSLDTDVTSSRLRLASMLYRKGDLRRAADVLNDVERRYDNNVHAVCGCGRNCGNELTPAFLNERTVNDWSYDIVKNNVALCVWFTRLEVFCAPPIMLFEMNKAMADGMRRTTFNEQHKSIEMGVVDSKPFLFYLQYLTYGSLGLRIRQYNALKNLYECISIPANENKLHHNDTAANLLGHCWEMEGDIEMALELYRASVRVVPRNNAAIWHIRRLTDTI